MPYSGPNVRAPKAGKLPPRPPSYVKTVKHRTGKGRFSKVLTWSMPSNKFEGHARRMSYYQERALLGLPLFEREDQ